jgi:hypothetical protein
VYFLGLLDLLSTRKKDLFENLPACCNFKNLPDCNKMFSLVLNFQQFGRAFELCSFCEIYSEQ